MKSNKTFGIVTLVAITFVIMLMTTGNSMQVADLDVVDIDTAVFEELDGIEGIGSIEEIGINEDTYAAGTSVTWHGTLDLYLTPAGTDERTQVVFGEPNLITDIGADRLRGFLNGSVISGETIANMSLSDDGSAASAAWTELPVEIAANGLERATGTMANNGTGAFNITYTWTASASQDCQLIGTHWDDTGELDGNLFSALKFTQQTLLVNDELEAVYSVEIS